MNARSQEVLLVLLFWLVAAGWADAAPEGPSAAKGKSEGYRLQDLDEPLEPLDPLLARTVDDQSRVDAMAWYMTGHFRESRNDFKGALEAYKKAADINPRAVEVYRVLVPLAFKLNQSEDAISYGMKAIQADPGDFELLRRIGVELARRGELPKSIQLLEQAAGLEAIDKKSAAYVLLMRDLAILYSATGQKEKAADSYLVVFEAITERNKYELDEKTRQALSTDVSTAPERIGDAFLDADRVELAVKAFEYAEKQGKSTPGKLSYSLSAVYLKAKQPDKALSELQKYFDAQLQSKGRSAYELLGQILESLEKSDELVGRLEALAEKDAFNATLQYYLAEQYVAAERFAEAEKLYKQALTSAPDTTGYLGLAAVYRQQKRPEELLDNLAQASSRGKGMEEIRTELEAIAKDEELVGALLEVGRKRAAGDAPTIDFVQSYLLVQLAVEAEKSDAAVEFYRVSLKKAADEQLAALYQEFGQYLMTGRKYAEAAKVFEEASKEPRLRGQQPVYLYYVSQAQELSGNTDAAVAAINQAKQQRPDISLFHFQEGWIYYHAQRYDEAVKIFEQVMEKFPQDRETVRRCRFSISNIHVQKGEMRKGEEVLEKILAEEPDDPSVNNDLGYLYADQGKNLEQAEQMIKKALKAEPENGAYLDSMGWVLYKLKRYEEAVEYLEKSSKTESGSDATIWDHLGDCYQQLKKPEKAKESWEKALEFGKQDSRPDAKLMERIEQKLKNQGEGGAPKPGSP